MAIGWLFASLLTAPAQFYTGDNQTLLIDGGSVETNGAFVIGPIYSYDMLIIQSGGKLSSVGGAIGVSGVDTNGIFNPGIGNSALVSGVGSIWTNTSSLDVGLSGGGSSLVVSNGATVLSGLDSVGMFTFENTVVITGTGSRWSGGELSLGSSNTIVINNGGLLSAAGTTLYGNGNSLATSDSDSVWSNYTAGFTISGSRNNLLVSQGALLSGGGSLLGNSNLVAVSGIGTAWNGGLSVGGSFNSVVISNEGKVFGAATIGTDAGSNNSVLVTGRRSLWTNSTIARLDLGAQGGSNVLTIANTGTVAAAVGVIGDALGANSLVISNGGALVLYGSDVFGHFSGNMGYGADNNSALVTGANSLWTNASDLYVGYTGSSNRLVVSDRGKVVDNSAYLGGASSSYDTALITDAGSRWDSTGSLSIGGSTSFSSLVISNGGSVSDGSALIGAGSFGSHNSVTVTDLSSSWTNSNFLFIGNSGSFNSLIISNFGIVAAGNSYIGYISGANSNSVVVTDIANWLNAQSLYVGEDGSFNRLAILNNARVFDANGYVGERSNAGSNSTLVAGSHTEWNNQQDLRVGDYGAFNSLLVSDGGSVLDSSGFIGFQTGANSNSVLVTDTASSWINSNLFVGHFASFNSLVISNGGTVVSNDGRVGGDPNSVNNTVLVAVGGSVWTNGDGLYVGDSGSLNALMISDGGEVVDNYGYIGYAGTANHNQVVVTGFKLLSYWNNERDLFVGYSGWFNSLIISNGATVNAANVYVGFSNISQGSEIDMNGGTLGVSANGVLDVRNGSLKLNSGLVDVGSLLVTNPAKGQVVLAGGTFSSYDTFVTNNGLLRVGDGTNTATYHLKATGTHTFGGGLEIANHATLEGCGTVNGHVQVDPGGTILINCGTLTFTGPVTNNGTIWALNGGVLNTMGPLVNNGVIVFNNGGTNFQGGFINNGSVVDAGNVGVQAGAAGADFVVHIQSVTNLTYQLQYSDSLAAPRPWPAVGLPQEGTGGLLTFVDPGGALASQRFYVVAIGTK